MREVRVVTKDNPAGIAQSYARCVMPRCTRFAVGVADVSDSRDPYDFLWPMCQECCIDEGLEFLQYRVWATAGC